ncbi:Voltage-gated potassium channel [Modestobacter italicus]|uniref:Voltage-gated potassium channel n=1 Tax=Modestobacter italicus (strain DSM 44449 / CECT 9708 / BC 501) TaxID=2732864 RepID=I4EVB6_MODI5|nr:potassium channel family protein [Modestobacter marinus]CCH87329.1 Voltage-gated potassium channel [Modestobacter marinus]
MSKDALRRRYEELSQWPLVLLALLFVASYAWGVLRPDLPHPLLVTLRVVTVVAWPVFLGDYVLRLALADHRWRFVRQNWVDGLAVLLPLLRPLRVLSLVRVARVLDRRLTTSLHGRVAAYVTLTASLVVFMASLAVYDAERGAPGASITSYGDAVWWALTTITTVGYGDEYPVTGDGRLVAVLLMVSGIALLGVVTAAVASWFVGRVAEAAQAQDDADDAALLVEVRELADEVRRLRAELADRDELGAQPLRTTGSG